MIALLLVAQIVVFSCPNCPPDTIDSIVIIDQRHFYELPEWFKRAKVGDKAELPEPCGCNTCYRYVEKVSETHVIDYGIRSRTLMMCESPYKLIEVK